MKAIAAMSRNRVIGKDGGLPWRLPEDFRWFKQATLGHAVLMGRKTFESLGRPLPGRLNLVATRHPDAGKLAGGAENVEIVRDLAAFRPADYTTAGREVFVAGGAEIYRQTLGRCAELLLTLVDREIEGGDAFFPEFESGFEPAGIILRGPGFEVRRYVNREMTNDE